MKQSQLVTKTQKANAQQDPSINAQLLERAGYISKLMAGVYTFLPLGLKVLTKIENIVREEMDALGGQEILMPGLQPKENWEKTGRWDKVDILFKLKGAGDRDLCLGPTHEEVVTPLLATFIQSYKDLPKHVYQVQTKFRNEARPKSGLLRGREFRMKDLYSFHANEQDLDIYYDKVKASYLKIFARCGLGDLTYLTYASGGTFSKYSHEFQTITPYGEDIIFVCNKCNVAINKEIIEELNKCLNCSNADLKSEKAIEVGNIFNLKTRFSDAFDLTYTDNNDEQKPVLMGCYGLGTSRLMGTIVEVLHDERGIIWPKEIAPFDIHLISLVKEAGDLDKVNKVYHELQNSGFDVLYDDRNVQAGEKFADADLLGMPLRLVLSNKTLAQNSAEVKLRNKTESQLISLDKLIEYLKNN